MNRRDFLVSSAVTGLVLAVPGRALAKDRCRIAWLISDSAPADALAKRAAIAGGPVVRVKDEAVSIWYDHTAPAIATGRLLRGVTRAGVAPLLERMAHLRGRLVPLPRTTLAAIPAEFEIWELRPWQVVTERTMRT